MEAYWDVHEAGWVVCPGPSDALVTPWSASSGRARRPVEPDAVLLRTRPAALPAQRLPVRARAAAAGS